MKKRIRGLVVLALFLFLSPFMANAATVTFNFDYAFSGTAPTGSAPWLTATFTDGIPGGGVSLSIAAGGLTGSEFVNGVYFNVDPALTVAATNIAFVSGSSSAPTPSSIQAGTNAYKADGDGFYDIMISFPTPASSRFNAGEVALFTITGVPSLTANSFTFLSQPAGGSGPFLAAAHIQGITTQYMTGASGWVASVPIPAALWMFAPAITFLMTAVKRRRTTSV